MMRSSILLVVLAALVLPARSQGALANLANNMPECSLTCFMREIPNSTCATNLTSECLCTDAALNAAVGACASKKCSVYELLQTKNVSGQGCGVPVRDRGTSFFAIGVVGMAVALIAYLLRLGASLPKQGRPISWDDATMGLVVAFAIPPAVFAWFLVDNGLGKDMWTLKAHQITNVLQYYFFGEIFYILALGVTKISILCFYLRVFPSKDFRRIIYGVMWLSVAYTVAFFFATTFQCTPVSYAWTQWDGLHTGTCNDIHLQGWIAAGINILLDAMVMILPLKHLAGLNMNIRRKLMVMAMFSVGIIVIVISVLRLYSLVHFANSKNITWDYFEAGYWSLLEIDVSIICGSMPAHRYLVSKLWPKIKLTFHSGQGQSTKPTGLSSAGTSRFDSVQKLSVKPKIDGDGDFVPLVNMDTGSLHPAEFESERNRSDLSRHSNIMRTQETIVSHNDVDHWPIASATTSKEHV